MTTETNATAEIIAPKLPPLPECVTLMLNGKSWTPGIAGTRSECDEFVNDNAYTYAIVTLTPPAPVRTAASEVEIFADYDANYGTKGYFGYPDAFLKGFRAAERYHGIGGGQ